VSHYQIIGRRPKRDPRKDISGSREKEKGKCLHPIKNSYSETPRTRISPPPKQKNKTLNQPPGPGKRNKKGQKKQVTAPSAIQRGGAGTQIEVTPQKVGTNPIYKEFRWGGWPQKLPLLWSDPRNERTCKGNRSIRAPNVMAPLRRPGRMDGMGERKQLPMENH